MTIDTRRRLVWAVALASFAITGVGLALRFVDLGDAEIDVFGFRGVEATWALAYTGAALLILHRQPSNSVGWLVLATGVTSALMLLAAQYGLATVVGGVDLPGGVYGAWFQAWSWVILVAMVLGFTPALFPDGKPQGRFGRGLLVIGVLAIILAVLSLGTEPGPLNDEASYADNPFPVEWMPHQVIESLGFFLLLILAVGSVVSLVRTYRSGDEVQRLQVKWLTLAYVAIGSLFSLVMASALALGEDRVNDTPYLWESAVATGFLLIPVAIAVAILRYRLYEVDIFINRAIIYGPLTALVAASYIGAVQLARVTFVAVTGERSDSELLAATLVAGTVFWMVRTRLIAVVDRHFKDPREPWKDLRALRTSITQSAQILEPSAVSAERLAQHVLAQCVSAYGAGGGTLALAGAAGRSGPVVHGDAEAPAAVSVDLAHEGTSLGTLALGNRDSGRPYSLRDHEALAETASTLAEILARKKGK